MFQMIFYFHYNYFLHPNWIAYCSHYVPTKQRIWKQKWKKLCSLPLCVHLDSWDVRTSLDNCLMYLSQLKMYHRNPLHCITAHGTMINHMVLTLTLPCPKFRKIFSHILHIFSIFYGQMYLHPTRVNRLLKSLHICIYVCSLWLFNNLRKRYQAIKVRKMWI